MLGLDWRAFEASKLHQNAGIRCLEIIGEAASKVSPETQARYPDISWRVMKDMRNRPIHGYGEVRHDLVWDVVQVDLPLLVDSIRPLVPPDKPA